MESDSTVQIISRDTILKYQNHPKSMENPCAVKNFRIYLNRSQISADHLKLLVDHDGIMTISDKEIDEETLVLRKVKGLLNKLTEANYRKMLDSIYGINQIRNDGTLDKLVDVVIFNIKSSLHFVPLYAILAKDIDTRCLWQFSDKKFSQALQKRCIQEFRLYQTREERDRIKEVIGAINDKDEKFEKEVKIRRDNNAITMFLGHMFKNGLTHVDNVIRIFQHLLRPLQGEQFVDSNNVDFMMNLYPVVIPKLAVINPAFFKDVAARIAQIHADDRLDTRHKLMLDDVIHSANTRAMSR